MVDLRLGAHHLVPRESVLHACTLLHLEGIFFALDVSNFLVEALVGAGFALGCRPHPFLHVVRSLGHGEGRQWLSPTLWAAAEIVQSRVGSPVDALSEGRVVFGGLVKLVHLMVDPFFATPLGPVDPELILDHRGILFGLILMKNLRATLSLLVLALLDPLLFNLVQLHRLHLVHRLNIPRGRVRPLQQRSIFEKLPFPLNHTSHVCSG